MDHHHHHHHHHHHPPPGGPPHEPPPPFPPPPHVHHTSHIPGPDPYPPPPFPPPPHVHHTSHIPGPDPYPPPPPPVVTVYPPPPVLHPHMPQFPPDVHHHTHHHDDNFASKPSVKMYSKAETSYSLSIRNGKVILARSNPSDPFQHWIKDEKFSTRVKDEEGLPSFALINKTTGQAMKHSIGATHPVQLIPYNPNVLDESILWSYKDLGDGYHAIRMVNNIRLNVDAFNGDKKHGGVHDGSIIVLWEWKKGDNQRWKIVPH